jgi:N-acetyl-gamma-glutamyl-phosphate reductase
MPSPVKAALLGASGYTGADLLRLGVNHPGLEFTVLTANTHAGKPMGAVFPHLAIAKLPDLVSNESVDWSAVDVVFCGLPHGASQAIIVEIVKANPNARIIDMSADYRLDDLGMYEKWYGAPHVSPELQKQAVYGLTEHYRDKIRDAKIIACPGCYPTGALLALLPLVKSGAISTEDMIIDAKSGVTGAGRGLKQNTLFSEAGESLTPYSIGNHRHTAELEQEIGKATGQTVTVNFTPHLIPMSRGELITAHVKLGSAKNAAELRAIWSGAYGSEPFIRIAAEKEIPSTGHVRGSNWTLLNAFDDRIAGRAIVIAAIDNLVKGSAGQALQNFNIAFGWPETTALEALPLFP